MNQNPSWYWFLGLCLAIGTACNRPVSQFLVSQEDTEAPANIEFINQSEKADSFFWDFGDGQTSDDINPTHRYVQSGDYRVILSASNGKKSRTSERVIHVDSPEETLVEIRTSYGNMLVKLYDETPQHRDNFIKLATEGFYDSLMFHRVIQGFMIQGGDPDSRNARRGQPLGSGGPGYQIPAEFDTTLIHIKGTLSAARRGDQVNAEKQSSGSQFYIVQGTLIDDNQLRMIERRKGFHYSDDQKKSYMEKGGTPFLDMEYTVFGQVIDGLQVIDRIASLQTDGMDRPQEDVRMQIVVIN